MPRICLSAKKEKRSEMNEEDEKRLFLTKTSKLEWATVVCTFICLSSLSLCLSVFISIHSSLLFIPLRSFVIPSTPIQLPYLFV